jgi:DNA phosphorothioation-associated putative methyltransferase
MRPTSGESVDQGRQVSGTVRAPDDDPHPALCRCVKLNLRTRQIECYDYAQSSNPPVLHRKESFLTPEHPLHGKFARLTAQEEKNGLLEDPSGIGTREGWAKRLTERGFALKGHRVVRANGPQVNGQADSQVQ